MKIEKQISPTLCGKIDNLILAGTNDTNKTREAIQFLKAYNAYCHMIDDLVDEHFFSEKTVDPFESTDLLLKILIHASAIYTTPFFIEYRHHLFPMVVHVTNTFADSVSMEHANEEWKQQFADAIRNTANDMVVAVVMMLAGWEAGREISLALREDSYVKHHTEDGVPV